MGAQSILKKRKTRGLLLYPEKKFIIMVSPMRTGGTEDGDGSAGSSVCGY